jgi:hypothetical protein
MFRISRGPEVDMRKDLPKEPDGLGKLSWRYEIIGVSRDWNWYRYWREKPCIAIFN